MKVRVRRNGKPIDPHERFVIKSRLAKSLLNYLDQCDLYLESVSQQPSYPDDGNRNLMLAILEDGLTCVLGYRKLKLHEGRWIPRQLHAIETVFYAFEWLFEEQPEHIYSFLSICSHLHLDPERVRNRTLAALGCTRKDIPYILLPMLEWIERKSRKSPLICAEALRKRKATLGNEPLLPF